MREIGHINKKLPVGEMNGINSELSVAQMNGSVDDGSSGQSE